MLLITKCQSSFIPLSYWLKEDNVIETNLTVARNSPGGHEHEGVNTFNAVVSMPDSKMLSVLLKCSK